MRMMPPVAPTRFDRCSMAQRAACSGSSPRRISSTAVLARHVRRIPSPCPVADAPPASSSAKVPAPNHRRVADAAALLAENAARAGGSGEHPCASRAMAPTVPVGTEPGASDPFEGPPISRRAHPSSLPRAWSARIRRAARRPQRRLRRRGRVAPRSARRARRRIGLRNGGIAHTPPARSVEPSMMAASSSMRPSSVRHAPVPALNKGSSSKARTATCTASSADAPPAKSAAAAPAARRHPSIRSASFSERPAPPCTRTDHASPASSGSSGPNHEALSAKRPSDEAMPRRRRGARRQDERRGRNPLRRDQMEDGDGRRRGGDPHGRPPKGGALRRGPERKTDRRDGKRDGGRQPGHRPLGQRLVNGRWRHLGELAARANDDAARCVEPSAVLRDPALGRGSNAGKSGDKSTPRANAKTGPTAPMAAPPTIAPSDALTGATPAAASALISPRERACSVAMNAAPPPARDTSAANRPMRPANVLAASSVPTITMKTSVASARASETVRRTRSQS